MESKDKKKKTGVWGKLIIRKEKVVVNVLKCRTSVLISAQVSGVDTTPARTASFYNHRKKQVL